MIQQTSSSTPLTPNKLRDTKPFIAFIDDDESVRDAAMSLIKAHGLEVKTYASRATFIVDLNGGSNPDCIVLDFHLPQINGVDLMQELLNRNIHTPVIIIAADVAHPLAIQALELGAVKVLQKPNISEDLLDKIHEIIST